MKLMEQHLDTRYGHIIISYDKNGQIRGVENFIFLNVFTFCSTFLLFR